MTTGHRTVFLFFLFCKMHYCYDLHLTFQINHTKDEVPLSRFKEEEKRANDEAVAIARKLEEKYVSSFFFFFAKQGRGPF